MRQVLFNIIHELNESQIPLSDVTVNSRSPKIVETVKEECPSLPNVMETSEFLGMESKVIIWIDSENRKYREVKYFFLFLADNEK